MSIPQQGGGPVESKADLVGYLAAGCRPRPEWRIGTEHEKFGYCVDTLKPLPYDGRRSVRAVLEGLAARFGWTPITEAGNIIGLSKDKANVSLEPGGQLELSGAPLESIHETCDEVNQHLAEVKAVADEIGVGFRRRLRQHVHLAAAEEGRGVRPRTILEHPQDDAGASRLRETAQLLEGMFRVHSPRAAGHQTDERSPLHQHRTRFTHCRFDSSTEVHTYNRRAACMRR